LVLQVSDGNDNNDMNAQLRFDGRVAIVTGAGGGLGRAHALLLAERGAHVVVNDMRAEDADRTTIEIMNTGGSAVAHTGDLADPAAGYDLVASAMQRCGRLDIVVNNAGNLESADFADMTPDAFDRMLSVNLRTALHVTLAAWPHLVAQQFGRVVSTTSNSGLFGAAGSTGYAAAKAGLWGLTRSLALEGAAHGINVNAIAPLAFTAMSQRSRVAPESWRSGEGDEWARRLDPHAVSPVVAWFAHPDCSLNGEVWTVAGGRVGRFVLGVNEGYDSDALTIEEVRNRSESLLEDPVVTQYRSGGEEGRALHRRLLRRGRSGRKGGSSGSGAGS
jgi:NAD(P)-dependent dehydrogenase (short-subunit alcohol dehydrogenase family)